MYDHDNSSDMARLRAQIDEVFDHCPIAELADKISLIAALSGTFTFIALVIALAVTAAH